MIITQLHIDSKIIYHSHIPTLRVFNNDHLRLHQYNVFMNLLAMQALILVYLCLQKGFNDLYVCMRPL